MFPFFPFPPAPHIIPILCVRSKSFLFKEPSLSSFVQGRPLTPWPPPYRAAAFLKIVPYLHPWLTAFLPISYPFPFTFPCFDPFSPSREKRPCLQGLFLSLAIQMALPPRPFFLATAFFLERTVAVRNFSWSPPFVRNLPFAGSFSTLFDQFLKPLNGVAAFFSKGLCGDPFPPSLLSVRLAKCL